MTLPRWRITAQRPDAAAPDRFEIGEVVVEARRLSIALDGRPIVRDVDLSVTAGEIVALVGPNGAGKTTLLHALAGDRAASGGAVLIDGVPIESFSPRQLARRRAVLPQHASVGFPFRVDEIVAMGRAPWPEASRLDDERVIAEALAEAGVSHLSARPLTELSGGEQARVGLARVLAQQGHILLLDEPTAALDIRHQEQVLAVAGGRAGRGSAVVVVLHDLRLAAAHADRVVLLHAGAVIADGPPEEVLTVARVSEAYDHAVDVWPHPTTGRPIVVPRALAHGGPMRDVRESY